MNKRVYVLEYDIVYHDVPDDHRIDYFSSDQRQEWINKYFHWHDKYYCANLSAYTLIFEKSLSKDEMVAIRDAL